MAEPQLHFHPTNAQIHLGPNPSHDADQAIKIDVQKFNFWYGSKQALSDICLQVYENEVTAFIGPSGCGKTTLLRCLNRSNDGDIIRCARITGRILLDGQDIYAGDIDPPVLRRRFGWVAQKPNTFPWSIHTNVSYAPRIHGLVDSRSGTDELVERSLRRVGLWDEVKDRLSEPGTDLSGGQQQRLCVARAIATDPDVILMDEPASALDPMATELLERLIDDLRRHYTIIIITHNMQQGARLAQRVAVFHLGRLVESGDAAEVFSNPQHDISMAYITGVFG